jgi:phosphoglycerate dehydrogenase-like enzyme
MATDRDINILVFANLEARHLEQIRAVDPRVRASVVTDQPRGTDAVPTAEIIVGWNIPREAVQCASRLKWIHSTAAGVDQLLYPEIRERGITITASMGIHQPLVEHVFAFLLALERRLHVAMRQQFQRKWDRAHTVGDEVAGKTLGILGLGTIGKQLVRKAQAFDMHVIGTKRTPTSIPGVDRVLPPEGLPEVLHGSDAVVVALPLTPQTRGLLGERELQMMKSTAWLINVGRGPIVQEAPLVRTLRAGRIAGAALDVFEHEPLRPDSPLYELENVILTPHVSGASPRYMDRAVPLFCDNLARYLRGAPLRNLVDPERGY